MPPDGPTAALELPRYPGLETRVHRWLRDWRKDLGRFPARLLAAALFLHMVFFFASLFTYTIFCQDVIAGDHSSCTGGVDSVLHPLHFAFLFAELLCFATLLTNMKQRVQRRARIRALDARTGPIEECVRDGIMGAETSARLPAVRAGLLDPLAPAPITKGITDTLLLLAILFLAVSFYLVSAGTNLFREAGGALRLDGEYASTMLVVNLLLLAAFGGLTFIAARAWYRLRPAANGFLEEAWDAFEAIEQDATRARAGTQAPQGPRISFRACPDRAVPRPRHLSRNQGPPTREQKDRPGRGPRWSNASRETSNRRWAEASPWTTPTWPPVSGSATPNSGTARSASSAPGGAASAGIPSP